MIDETEHTCQFCYYEYFDGRAYPCSMCVCGEERKDMFQPKGRQNKRKDEPQTGYCNECKWFGDKQVCGICRSKHLYVPKDEPQTDVYEYHNGEWVKPDCPWK